MGVGTPENRRRLGDCGACASVAAALRTFQNDRPVMEQAVSAIRNLAIEEENTKRLGSEGACEAVINAMRIYHNEPAFMSKACAAVVNLAGGNQDNKRRMGMGGAIECVLGALRAFPTDAAIVEQGLWAVKNLAVDPDNTQRLGAAGICEVIINALRSFVSDTRVLVSESCPETAPRLSDSQNSSSAAVQSRLTSSCTEPHDTHACPTDPDGWSAAAGGCGRGRAGPGAGGGCQRFWWERRQQAPAGAAGRVRGHRVGHAGLPQRQGHPAAG